MNNFEGFKAGPTDKKIIQELCAITGRNKSQVIRNSLSFAYMLTKIIQDPAHFLSFFLKLLDSKKRFQKNVDKKMGIDSDNV